MKCSAYLIFSLTVILCFWTFIGCAPPKDTGQIDNPVPEEKMTSRSTEESALRLHGSNSLGARFIPELVAAFLEEKGASTVIRHSEVESNRILVKGLFPNTSKSQVVEIIFKDSDMAFKNLAAGKCDIGFTSRRIELEEVNALASLGRMTSQKSEHILALDGIAIVVQRNNPVDMLTTNQIIGIFSGNIQDWQAVGGSPGKITVYAPEEPSGVYEAFQQIVLGEKHLSNDALRVQSGVELSNSVANDSTGIGFVKSAYTRQAKVLAITDGESEPLRPEVFHIGTEDYLFSHRLYLYLPGNSTHKTAREFVEFALSRKGQKIVALNNLVDLTISPPPPPPPIPDHAPHVKPYENMMEMAVQLPLNIRFQLDSSELDNKAHRDIGRIVESLERNTQYQNQVIVLLGFTDDRGDRPYNQELSEKRAESVAEKLREKGLAPVKVVGFGEDVPVATNKTREGRARNRRVEVWLVSPDFSLPTREEIINAQTSQEEVSGDDPDRNSGSNRTAAGATPLILKDNKKEEAGFIDYDKGDKTDWYKVEIGEEGRLTYEIDQETAGTPLVIQFYPPVLDYRSLPEEPIKEITLIGQDTQLYTIEKTQPGRYYTKIFVQQPGEASQHTIYITFTKTETSQEPDSPPSHPVDPQPPQIIISSPEISSSEQSVTTSEEKVVITGRVEASRPIYKIEINGTKIPLEEGDGFVAEKQRYVKKISYPTPAMEIGASVSITIVAWDTKGLFEEIRFRIFRIPADSEQIPEADPSSDPLHTPETDPSAPDTSAPVITILEPEAGSIVTQASITIKGRVEDESQIARITVDDQLIPIGETRGFNAESLKVQKFEHTIDLKLGMNDIVITAQDKFGNRESKTIQIQRTE